MKVVEEFNQVSLLDRIKEAETIDELLLLDTEGSEYKWASDKTRRKWVRAIQRRKSQLSKAPKRKGGNK